jgi:hypothetical protein
MQERAKMVSPWTRPGTQLPLVRIRHGRNTLVAASGAGIHVLVHWCAELDRTQPCLADHCLHCVSGSPRRPLSYLPVYLWSLWDSKLTWIPAVVELPLGAGRHLESIQQKETWLSRSRPNGPVIFADGQAPVHFPKNVVIEIAPTLLAIWRLPGNSIVRLVREESQWTEGTEPTVDMPLSADRIGAGSYSAGSKKYG